MTAAILADSEGDQDALTNRAILMRGACGKQGEAMGTEESSQAPAENEPRAANEPGKTEIAPLSKSTLVTPSPAAGSCSIG